MKINFKLLQTILIIVLICCVMGMLWWIAWYLAKQSEGIPRRVRSEYEKVSADYSASLGSSLLQCLSDKGEVYLVTGSGGFTNISYYFDLSGNKIGSFTSSDLSIGLAEKPPVEVQYDSCKTLKQNKPELQQ